MSLLEIVNFKKIVKTLIACLKVKKTFKKKIKLEVYGNEKRRLPSNEARASGNYKFMSADDFSHELAQISVIARATKTDL